MTIGKQCGPAAVAGAFLLSIGLCGLAGCGNDSAGAAGGLPGSGQGGAYLSKQTQEESGKSNRPVSGVPPEASRSPQGNGSGGQKK